MKKIFVFLLSLCVIGVVAWEVYKLTRTTPVLPEQASQELIDLHDIDFSFVGYLPNPSDGSIMDGATFVYETPGAPAQTVPLIFDGKSICTFNQQSSPCALLSASAKALIGEKRAFIEGIRTDKGVLVRNIALDKEENRMFGYIRSLRDNNANMLIDVDEVEFLFGEEALEASVQDTGCPPDTIEDCAPSMSNNFYISNPSEEIQTLLLLPETKIRIFKNVGAPDLEEVDLGEFAQRYAPQKELMHLYPFAIVLDGASVVSLEEQYLP